MKDEYIISDFENGNIIERTESSIIFETSTRKYHISIKHDHCIVHHGWLDNSNACQSKLDYAQYEALINRIKNHK